MQDAQILDKTLLNGYLNTLGKDIVQQMLDLYIQQSIIYLDDINAAVEQESTDLWQERCHKMKGAAASVGMKLVHEKLGSIEKSTQPAQQKWQMIENLVTLNQQAIKNFSQWLHLI